MKIELPKKALVTGGAGFLGTHLCKRLLADGWCRRTGCCCFRVGLPGDLLEGSK